MQLNTDILYIVHWKSLTSEPNGKKKLPALKNLIIPGRQRKTALHAHESEDRIRRHHEGQVYAEMVKQ